MKRILFLLLVLAFVAVPALGIGNLVNDGEGLLAYEEAANLESQYASYTDFTPVLVTVDSFGGRSAESFAGHFYDQMGYPYDGILLLVSLTEGEWYILTNGACYDRISDWDAEEMGEILVQYLRDGEYYEAFYRFPELADQYMSASESFVGGVDGPGAVYETHSKNYGKTIAICMAVGLVIGGISVGVLSYRMKTVRSQSGASDYVRADSMVLTNQRDIFLYSHVTRSTRPKSNSSGRPGGGSRGGAGGRI